MTRGLIESLDLSHAEPVCALLRAAARANREAPCRRASIDVIEMTEEGRPVTLIATGDLHDNPLHLVRLVEAAGMGGGGSDGATQRRGDEGIGPVKHLVLHEIIHSDRLVNGMDFSYRALVRVAALKAAFPGRVHTLLANHELSQITGAGIVKDGVKVVEAFDDAVEYVFGDDAAAVEEAIAEFIRSMPLALRAHCKGKDILCSHSLPPAWMMSRFDPGVLSRELTHADFEPRQGSAHIMVWGRGYDHELLEDLTERWGVSMFILGHEKAENGVMLVPPNAIVLNSDHDKGVYLPIDLTNPPRPEEAVGMVVRLG